MLPTNFYPMLATIAEPFDSANFTFEIKWDGYRCLSFLDQDTRLLSRNQKEISAIFPELLNLHQKVKQKGCLIDGEIVALRNGKPSFLELQKRAQIRDPQKINLWKTKIPIVYIAFDLLYLNQKKICHLPLEERRELLLINCLFGDEFIPSSFIEKNGVAYFAATTKLGLEGVIAKKKGTPYLPGKRVKTWLKFKRKLLQNFVICGYLTNPIDKSTWRSLILGAYRDDKLTFTGLVGSGFSIPEKELIKNELEGLICDLSPFNGAPVQQKNIVWVKPQIVCEVEYLERTDEGNLRHPVFKRFRPDLKITDCHYEEKSDFATG